MGGEAGLPRQPAHLGLGQSAYGKQAAGQLLLVQATQEITLILVQVHAFFQKILAAGTGDARVVPGGDKIRAQLQRLIQEGLEFDFLVAQHVRVGGAPGAVFLQEVAEYGIPVFIREVYGVQRYLQAIADLHGVIHIAFPHAAPGLGGFIPVLHEQGLDLITLFLQQQGGDGRINTAG